MKGAIIDLRDGSVLARWEDETAEAFPLPPDGCSYIEVSDKVYDILATIVNEDGRLHWIAVGAEIQQKPPPRQRPFYAIVNTSTRVVVALDRSVPSFVNPGLEVVRVSADDYGKMSEALSLDKRANLPAWQCEADGTVAARADARPVLEVSMSDSQILAGVEHTVSFELKDSQGQRLSFSGTRPIIVEVDGVSRVVALTLAAGVASISRVFAVGRYRVGTADPGTYRIAGANSFEVVEAW